jgi:hypothetical protein
MKNLDLLNAKLLLMSAKMEVESWTNSAGICLILSILFSDKEGVAAIAANVLFLAAAIIMIFFTYRHRKTIYNLEELIENYEK